MEEVFSRCSLKEEVLVRSNGQSATIVEMIIPRFEQLPIEVLIELFEFFSAAELTQTFYDLNANLNAIIEQRTPLHFSFDIWSLRKNSVPPAFMLAFNPAQVKSLTLFLLEKMTPSTDL
jgi:hypothetical protein